MKSKLNRSLNKNSSAVEFDNANKSQKQSLKPQLEEDQKLTAKTTKSKENSSVTAAITDEEAELN